MTSVAFDHTYVRIAILLILCACESPGVNQHEALDTTMADSALVAPQEEIADAARALVECDTLICEVVLQPIVSLSDGEMPGLLGSTVMFSLYRDQRGRYVVPTLAGDMFAVFDSGGSLIATVGRRGAGPGEYQRIAKPFGAAGDSLYVPDRALGRISVYSGDLVFRRTIAAPYIPVMGFDDGTMIVAQQIMTSNLIGQPLHVLTEDGRIERSFGADTPQYRRDLRLFTTRTVGHAGDGTVWTTPPGRLLVEKWDARTGQRVKRLSTTVVWFRDTPAHTQPHQSPGTVVEGIWEDGTGILWLLVRVEDLDWPPANPVPADREVPWTVEDSNARNDWVLMAVDSASGRVLGQRRFREGVYHYTPTPLVVTDVVSPAGPDVAFDVWRPVVSRKR